MEVHDMVSSILKEKGNEVWWVSPDATVYEALEKIADKNIGALLVMNGDEVVGILSERDYARKIILKARSSKQTKVREIMNSPAITIRTNSSVDEAMQVMSDHHIRHLPVLNDSGKLAGVISIGDLVKYIISSHETTIQHLHSYIAGGSQTPFAPVARGTERGRS